MEIKNIIGHLKQAQQVTIITGAGASKAAGIPLAGEFVDRINRHFGHCLSALSDEEKQNYGAVMGELSPGDRKGLIQPILKKARINWGQIALACLIKSEINVERVLTFNFDQILEKACALMGMHLPVYDFGVSPTNDISYLASPAIFHLHGQSYGLRMMNSGDETESHRKKLERLLEDSLRNHVVLVIGYSGEADPAYETMVEVFNSNNHLIWCGHGDEPKEHLRPLLDQDYAHYVGNCDFDKTMIELARDLGCFPPEIFKNPPAHLLEELAEVADWPFEGDDAESIDILTDTRDQLKTAKKTWTRGEAGEAQLKAMEGRMADVKEDGTVEASQKLLRAWDFVSKGNDLSDEANTLSGKAQTDAFKQSYEKYAKAVDIKPDMHEAFNNWGNALLDEARTLSGKAQTDAFKQSYEKFAKAVDIKPDKHKAFNSWGNALSAEAKTLSGKAQSDAFKQAYEKYAKAVDIKPDKHEAFNNWGSALFDEARTLSGKAQSDAFKQSYEKYAKAVDIKPDMHEAFNNWGNALLDEAKTLSGKARRHKLDQVGEKLQRSKEIQGKGSYNLACLYVLRGETENALKELELCLADGTLPNRSYLEADEDLDPLREKPRFIALLEQAE